MNEDGGCRMGNLSDVSAYNHMMCELFQAMKELGGSGTIREIDGKTIEILQLTPEVQEIAHGNSGKTDLLRPENFLRLPSRRQTDRGNAH